MSPILVVLAAIVAIAGFVILIYNGLVMKRQRVNQAFADVDVQLKQRQNLIPNLVETVKGYASHEKETLDAVISARFYNSAVQDYNTSREQFPGSIVAGMFNFEGREFFDVGVEGREALSTVPEVKF